MGWNINIIMIIIFNTDQVKTYSIVYAWIPFNFVFKLEVAGDKTVLQHYTSMQETM